MSTGGLDAELVRTAPNGRVLLAPVGSAAPTNVETALTSAWHEVGYIDEDGVSISPDVSTDAIKKWQSVMPVKYTLQEVSLEVKFMMNQVDQTNTEIYFFGAQWVQEANGNAHMTVPSSPSITDLERAMVIEFTDDRDDITRLYFPRGIIIERDEITLNKGDVKLGLTYHAMDASGDMFEIFSNNPSLYSS